MSRLSPEQKQLILDFYFRCGEEEEINKGRDLIASDTEAAHLYSRLEDTLTELDSVKYEPCPENLAELTIARLKLAARAQKQSAGHPSRLAELLDQESRKNFKLPDSSAPSLPSRVPVSDKPNFLRVGFEIAAMAASIVLISGLLMPAFSTMRAHSRQVACQANLGRIGTAMTTYANDNDGAFASARLQPGDPWWMVGDQSERPRSSTRYVWQLVRQGYVRGEDFVCRGHRGAVPLHYDPVSMSCMQDFASPQNVSYSVMLVGNRKIGIVGRQILMSDMNPIFVRFREQSDFYRNRDEFEKILLNENLKKMLSPNHRQKGQNALFGDGSVEFLTVRQYRGDDIFTVRGVEEYRGREVPVDENDIFLVP